MPFRTGGNMTWVRVLVTGGVWDCYGKVMGTAGVMKAQCRIGDDNG